MKLTKFILLNMAILLLAVYAHASDEISIPMTIEADSVQAGQTITYTLTAAEDNDEIAVGTIFFRPSEGLTYVDCQIGKNLADLHTVRTVTPLYGENTGAYGISFLSSNGVSIPAGEVCRIEFQVGNDVDDEVSLQVYGYDLIRTDYEEIEVEFNGVSGPLTLTTPVLPATEEPEAEFTDGVQLNSKSISLGSNLGVNFKMTVPEHFINSSYMTFIVHGRSLTIPTSTLTPDSNGQYVFTCNVTSIEMAESIQAVFTYGENTASMTYSVADYITAYEEVSSNYAQEVTNLVHALADYGHHAQTFLSKYRSWTIGKDYAEMSGYTDSFSAEELEAVQSEVANYALTYETNADISAVNIGLNLESETTIYVYLTPSANYAGSISCTEGYTVEKNGNRYRIVISNIMAHQLGNTYTLTINTDSGSSVVQVSALSYANSIFNSTTMNEVDHYFAVAIYNYYAKAIAYLQQ